MPDGVKLQMVGLSGIAIPPDRCRQLRPDVVDQLMDSIRMQGLLHPIILRPRARNGIGYILVAGRHRLEAVRKLKHESIRAEIREGLKADAAELIEIDENLIRADLSPAETALHSARRKELYETLHPETKSAKKSGGGGGRRKKNESQNETHSGATPAFVDDTAKKTGKGRSTVARDVARAKGCVVLDQITGTCLDVGSEIDALCKLPEKEQRTLAKAAKRHKVSAKTRLKQIERNEREKELGAKQLALPAKRYGVILADPEWRFEPWSRETGMDRAADNHYPTSITEVIAARNVPSIAAEDCALFLWATVPMLPQALLVMAAWGFDYRTHFVWAKDRIGTGYWNRNRHELLLLGIKGNVPCPAPGDQWESLAEAKVGEHSVKPEHFYTLIESYFPTLPRIELNARRARPGWDAWGNEVEPQSEWTEMWQRPFAGTDAERAANSAKPPA